MVKKILIGLLIVVIAVAGGLGTWHFYKENKTTLSTLTETQGQLQNAQAQLAAIGTMTEVYGLATNVMSGEEIKETDLIPIHIPTSAAPSTSFTVDAGTAGLVGKHYRCNYNSNVIITQEMLMSEEEETGGIMAYPIELTFNSVPVTLEPGDIIDLRFLLANGEEYVVLDHKEVKAIYNTTVTLHVNEEENAIINSMYSDLSVYSTSCIAYLFKYLEPGNKQTLSFYPVLTELEDFLMYNPNITDVTRCVNTTLRDHLNQQLLILSDSANGANSQMYMAHINGALSGQLQFRQQYMQDKQAEAEAQAAGEIPADGGDYTYTEDVTSTEEVDLEAIE